MEICDYSYSKKKRLKYITDSSYLHSKFDDIEKVLSKMKTEAEDICRSVGQVSDNAETNYKYYSKCEQLVNTKIEEVNSKIKNTPKQISQQVYVNRSDGTSERVTRYYPNPEIPILESRLRELESKESYLKSLLEKLNSISKKYNRIYEIYSEFSSKISDAQTAIKSIENQADRNFQEVDKCIDSAAQAIHQCLSIRMDRNYEVKTYIKKIVVD